jgi:hypothetical protein
VHLPEKGLSRLWRLKQKLVMGFPLLACGRLGLLAVLNGLELEQAKVILPAYTCFEIASAVVASANHADNDMDVHLLKQALTPQARAVVATYMYGYPTDVNAIRATVGDGRDIIVEDAAMGRINHRPTIAVFMVMWKFLVLDPVSRCLLLKVAFWWPIRQICMER